MQHADMPDKHAIHSHEPSFWRHGTGPQDLLDNKYLGALPRIISGLPVLSLAHGYMSPDPPKSPGIHPAHPMKTL